jgi:hypothetical protein
MGRAGAGASTTRSQPAHESLNTLIAASNPVPIDKILIDTHRVTASRQLQLDHLPVCFTGSGWALANLLRQPHFRKKAVITSSAGFELSEPVVTEVAAFAGGFRPQPPGARNAIPADLK